MATRPRARRCVPALAGTHVPLVFDVPGPEEESDIADEALREDRALNNPRPQ